MDAGTPFMSYIENNLGHLLGAWFAWRRADATPAGDET